jgi:hypothetical protein
MWVVSLKLDYSDVWQNNGGMDREFFSYKIQKWLKFNFTFTVVTCTVQKRTIQENYPSGNNKQHELAGDVEDSNKEGKRGKGNGK